MALKTPLFDRHVALGGRIVDFAGWSLPVQFAGVIAEHQAVRTRAGLFDVSHMGELLLTGPDALENLQRLLSNEYGDLRSGRARYGLLCNEAGGVVDDVVVYRFNSRRYWIVVNAANRQKDYEWILAHLSGDVQLRDLSDETAQIALQGPAAPAILSELCDKEALPPSRFRFQANMDVAGVNCLVSRTGYTGEDGFELYCAPADAPGLWDALLAAGEPHGLVPCGLGARDTLRLEAAMPLYGHELSMEISPLEAGLAPFVKLEKPDFIGRAAILSRGAPRRRVGLKIDGRGIAREGYAVYAGDQAVGAVTSGTHCPSLGGAYAMALVNAHYTMPGGPGLSVEIRGQRVPASLTELPFYKAERPKQG